MFPARQNGERQEEANRWFEANRAEVRRRATTLLWRACPGGRVPELVDDVESEVWFWQMRRVQRGLALWYHLGFLVRLIVRNVLSAKHFTGSYPAVDLSTGRAGSAHRCEPLNEESTGTRPGDSWDPARAAQLRVDLETALRTCSGRVRRIFLLREQGYSRAQIAAILRISVRRLEDLITIGRAALRTIVDD